MQKDSTPLSFNISAILSTANPLPMPPRSTLIPSAAFITPSPSTDSFSQPEARRARSSSSWEGRTPRRRDFFHKRMKGPSVGSKAPRVKRAYSRDSDNTLRNSGETGTFTPAGAAFRAASWLSASMADITPSQNTAQASARMQASSVRPSSMP